MHLYIMVRNRSGKTSLDVADPFSKMILSQKVSAKIHGYYDSVQRYAKQKYSSAKPITRVFVLGNPGAGKSSLVETLKREGFVDSFKRVSESSVPPHTAGIVPTIHDSKLYGRVLFYDFAGDAEYYSSHAAILENLACSRKGDNIFVIVVDMREESHKISSTLEYWSTFIQHHNFKSKKPVFVIVGSHIDKLAKGEAKKKREILNQICMKLRSKTTSGAAYFLLDCCNPRDVSTLQKYLISLTSTSEHYTLSLEASILLGVLQKDFSNVTSCTMSTILSHIESTGLALPIQIEALCSVLQELHDIGLLFVVSGSTSESQVILDISQLTNMVHQLLFSKEASRESLLAEDHLSSFNIGVIPDDKLAEILPEYITKECLIHLQYCQEINHKDVMAFPSLMSSTQPTKQSFDPLLSGSLQYR